MATIFSSSSISTTSKLNPTQTTSTATTSFNLSLSSSSSVFLNNSSKISNRALVLARPGRVSPSKRGMTCNSLFGLGVPELVVIAGVTALVFGPKAIPEAGRSFGKTIKSFQQAAKEFESELMKESESPVGIPAEQSNAASEEKKEVNF